MNRWAAMEINLLLSAMPLRLAAQIERGVPAGGVVQLKLMPGRTYLAVTPAQWQVLEMFGETRTVPQVLETLLEQRRCPPLSEFYELILKAARAGMLQEMDRAPVNVPACDWPLRIRPRGAGWAGGLILVAGLVCCAVNAPALPENWRDAAASLGLLGLAGGLGTGLSASLLRGAGGEVVRRGRWRISTADACMLPLVAQRAVWLAPLAVHALAAGLLAWLRPEWSSLPLLGLLVQLRPFGRGRFGILLRTLGRSRVTDSGRDFLFPPNRTPRARWGRMCSRLRHPVAWLQGVHVIGWCLAIGLFLSGATELLAANLGFPTALTPWSGVAPAGLLALLGLSCGGRECIGRLRASAQARRETLGLWRRRWGGRPREAPDANARRRAVQRSPLLRLLTEPQQHELAAALTPLAVGPWRTLHGFEETATHVSLIVSGQVGIYRESSAGRKVLVQTLCEDDLVGLHAVVNPAQPRLLYRTLTPVRLLRVDWRAAMELVLARLSQEALANYGQKMPFLARIPLCQNWHMRAVQRLAEMAQIRDYPPEQVMLQEGSFSEDFFVLLEGDARVTQSGRWRARLGRGDFFGEVGLLLNGNSTARVIASRHVRCLCVRRREFMRFVARNYSVALELERVSSARLGFPIFPLVPQNFRAIH